MLAKRLIVWVFALAVIASAPFVFPSSSRLVFVDHPAEAEQIAFN
ncbi:MAG TPA: hypothetical protein VG942_09685 [Hyphomonadaceae bacterium]|nr:hypothetical protein [Hyphomonadaceae bacterium]